MFGQNVGLTRLGKNAARYGLMLVALGLAAACASPPPESDAAARQAFYEANDPLEPLNRTIWDFNLFFDRILLRPVAIAYRDVVPDPIQTGVRNFLDNLKQPLNIANSLLQGNPQRAGDATGRFLTNTLVGFGGVLDIVPAIPKVEEDFGQTLAVWGANDGAYLMLPILGPSNPRDLTGLVVDSFADPFNYAATRNDHYWIPITRAVVNAVDVRSRNIKTLDDIEAQSIDFYAAVRSLVRQRRMDEIRNGALPDKTAPYPTVPLTGIQNDDGITKKSVVAVN